MPDERDDAKRPEPKVEEPERSTDANAPLDPNDVVPVPVAMEPAEIDERAQVVEALRAREGRTSRDEGDDDTGMK